MRLRGVPANDEIPGGLEEVLDRHSLLCQLICDKCHWKMGAEEKACPHFLETQSRREQVCVCVYVGVI